MSSWAANVPTTPVDASTSPAHRSTAGPSRGSTTPTASSSGPATTTTMPAVNARAAHQPGEPRSAPVMRSPVSPVRRTWMATRSTTAVSSQRADRTSATVGMPVL